MRRISSLPTAEFCPRVDRIGQDVESTQSARSTAFHAYCDTGVWPKSVENLPEVDREEIQKWMVPIPFNLKLGDVTHMLRYQTATREQVVALDWSFEHVEIDPTVPQADIAAKYPQVMIVGHLDMAWDRPDLDLVIVCDIKSSIYAVKDRCDSLQLHGYGLALAKKLGRSRYVTAIWDATDGEYCVRQEAIDIDGFEAEDVRARIKKAATERDGAFLTGSHCGGCWKRTSCPAHIGDLNPESEFFNVLAGTATEAEVREALVKIKQNGDTANKVAEAIKGWVQRRGPVRSEDGSKEYRCSMRAGKESLDKAAVERALGDPGLKSYMKKGREFPVFDWRKKD